MLPKAVYSKVIQGLRKIKEDWEEDRVDNPESVHYEIDSELKRLIKHCILEGRVNCHGNMDREILTDQTIDYLIKKKILVGSSYGGVSFPLPEGHKKLPSKEEFIKEIQTKFNNPS